MEDTDDDLQRPTKRDWRFAGWISIFVGIGFLYNLFVFYSGAETNTDRLLCFSIAALVGLLWGIFWFYLPIGGEHPGVLRPDLMRIVFVVALLCIVLSLLIDSFTLASVAFLSIFLFPFLDWLKIPKKVPHHPLGALLYSVFQVIILTLVSLLIQQPL